nr:MAG TPA: hypothetical protein [Caudoviricetes sp.]
MLCLLRINTPVFNKLSDNSLDRRVHTRVKYTPPPRGVWYIFQKFLLERR